jgi:hypothetical protein
MSVCLRLIFLSANFRKTALLRKPAIRIGGKEEPREKTPEKLKYLQHLAISGLRRSGPEVGKVDAPDLCPIFLYLVFLPKALWAFGRIRVKVRSVGFFLPLRVFLSLEKTLV